MHSNVALRSRGAVRSPELGALATGVRLGALFGPSVFGVTAAGVALPSVASALPGAPATTIWVLTVHALALGVATAVFGRLADAWGVRCTLLTGSVVLGLGALVCLTAPSLQALVVGRFVLATGSGAMMAAALALAASIEPDLRAKVLAGFGATIAVFAGSATLAGGLVTELVTWRATLVLPVLSLAAVPLCLRAATQRPGSGQPVDILGAGLLAVAATTVVLLIQAHTLALAPPLFAATALLAALAAAALAWRVRRAPEGFLPRALAADRAFVLASATGFGVFGGLFGAMYAVPQLLVNAHGWSVLDVGAALLPGAVAGAALARAASRLAASRLGGHRLLAALATAFAIVLGLAGLTGAAIVPLIAGTFFGFAAFAVTQVVLTNQISRSVPAAQRGAAMGLLNLAFLTGGAVGSATAGALSRPLGLPAALTCVAVLPLVAGALAFRGRTGKTLR